MTENDKLRDLVERGLALCIRGRVLDRRWGEGGSGTILMAAEIVHDDLLSEWERDAREAMSVCGPVSEDGE